ncbi:MAG: glycosyltransferase family 2 protein [Methanotrichaceae archaeon]
MNDTRFSIVIPTRNRHKTLYHCLRTCVAQMFHSFEIIVCDNCSSPETRRTVESFESEKIKYIRSDVPLAMSQNWELAISHAEGEYIILIGDDDGLLLNSLWKIDQLLKVLGVRALSWIHVGYNWPNSIIATNKLTIPLVVRNEVLQSREVISNYADCKAGLPFLPGLYHSAIHKDLIALLREKTGRVFDALSHDVYAGFAFAYLAQSYVMIGAPMSIDGHSVESGHCNVLYAKDSPALKEFDALNIKAHIVCHPQIPDVPVAPAIIADSFQRAKDALFPRDKISVNRKKLVIRCIESLRERYRRGIDGDEEWRRHLGKIHDSLADDARLQRWFDSNFKNPVVQDVDLPKWRQLLKKCDRKFFADRSNESGSSNGFEKGFDETSGNLVLNASDFGLRNVFDVAEFCEKFYNTDINRLKWHYQKIGLDRSMLIRKARSQIEELLYCSGRR